MLETLEQPQRTVLSGIRRTDTVVLTREQLLDRLGRSLRGKPVWDTFRRIEKGALTNPWSVVKGLSSMLTHVAIEVEHGHVEFQPLAVELYEALGKAVFNSKGTAT